MPRLTANPPTEPVRQAIGTGQVRYDDLRDDLDERLLDTGLMQLAKNGEVSLLVVGGSLCIRRER